jgi:Protein of unknown function (DUF4232)
MTRTSSAVLAALALLSPAACGAPAAAPESQASHAAVSSTPLFQPSIAASPTPSSPAASATPALTGQGDPGSRCHTRQLDLKFAGAQGAAGTMFLTFRLANTGAAPCLIRGFVGMQMLDAAGGPLATRVVRNGGFFANQPPPSGFQLRPAAWGAPAATAATFQVAYSDVPRAGEAGCPQAFQLLVTPPDEFDHLALPVDGWTLAPCNHGELDVTPVRPPGVAPL